MSAPDLPDDLRDWPIDPFALLGVEPGAANTDIKRAYTRLVRRFKPEHHPDQFRRIREAYETCLERSVWYRPEPTDPAEPEAPEPERAVGFRGPVVDAPVVSPHEQPVNRPAPESDPVESLWEAALDGREAEAYAGLVRLHESDPSRPVIPLRAYWVLALSPELDRERTKHHWLARALVQSQLNGPAAELYRRELEAAPEAALDGPYEPGPYTRILAAKAAPDDQLAVARWRLAAAGRLKWSHHILSDLTVLRATLPVNDEPNWLALLVTANGWAVWAEHPELRQFIRSELKSLAHFELSHAPLFDRLEETEQVAKDVEWGRYAGIPGAFLDLVQIAWADPGYARPEEVEAAAADVVSWEDQALNKLDGTFIKRGAYLALAGREFDHYLYARNLVGDPEFPPDRIRGIARQLGVRRAVSYSSLRQQILALLTQHSIDPLEFAAALEEEENELYRVYAIELRNDPVLRVVWLANRIQLG